MVILLTNDDGIQAAGLWALYDKFAPSHRITVVAPDRERSAIGHAITLHAPIRADGVSMNGAKRAYAVDGTPADCIKLAVAELMENEPDLVISGINPGANVGVNVNYSGTLAAAREAALYGIPAMAVSIQGKSPSHYNDAAVIIEKLINEMDWRGLPQGTLLNVNVPDLPRERLKGIRLSRQGTAHYKERLEKRLDPRQRPYYWYGSYSPEAIGDEDVDAVALADDYISITPLRCDATDYDHLDTLKTWNIRI
jgi:5'-nucleotidase